MMEEEQLFVAIGTKIKDAEQGKLFGKPCFKINGKAFICFFNREMVFKLKDDWHKKALDLNGSQLFDPSGKKRPMKEWVQVSFKNHSHWESFSKAALKYVKESA